MVVLRLQCKVKLFDYSTVALFTKTSENFYCSNGGCRSKKQKRRKKKKLAIQNSNPSADSSNSDDSYNLTLRLDCAAEGRHQEHQLLFS